MAENKASSRATEAVSKETLGGGLTTFLGLLFLAAYCGGEVRASDKQPPVERIDSTPTTVVIPTVEPTVEPTRTPTPEPTSVPTQRPERRRGGGLGVQIPEVEYTWWSGFKEEELQFFRSAALFVEEVDPERAELFSELVDQVRVDLNLDSDAAAGGHEVSVNTSKLLNEQFYTLPQRLQNIIIAALIFEHEVEHLVQEEEMGRLNWIELCQNNIDLVIKLEQEGYSRQRDFVRLVWDNLTEDEREQLAGYLADLEKQAENPTTRCDN